MQKMFRKAERLEADDPQLQEIVQAACAALTEHAELEEELFYPALQEQAPDLIAEAQVEHDVAKQLIAQLEGAAAGDEQYKAMFKVLGEYVNHHIEEEESQVFRAAKRAKLDTAAIGEQILARKQGAAAEPDESSDKPRGGARSSTRGGRGRSASGGGRRGSAATSASEDEDRRIDEGLDNEDTSTGGDTGDDSERPGRGGRDRLEARGAEDEDFGSSDVEGIGSRERSGSSRDAS